MQLLDDEDLYSQTKTLSLTDLKRIIAAVNNWLYRLLWLAPALDVARGGGYNALSATAASPSPSVIDPQLEHLHSVFVAGKLYNQLLCRHERRPFVDPDVWLWTHLSPNDLLLEVRTSGGSAVVPQQRADEAISSLQTVHFANPRMKTVLAVVPQVNLLVAVLYLMLVLVLVLQAVLLL